jgi:uncharacterized repeat protein (TIGR01451 family)
MYYRQSVLWPGLTQAKPYLKWVIITLICIAHPLAAQAEGSRNLFPAVAPSGGASRYRTHLEWRTGVYATRIRRRTLLKIYAKQNEYILMGSSAVGVDQGDILLFHPGQVMGAIGSEMLPALPDFKCTTQPGRGRITSRPHELAGPNSIIGNGNPTGYQPCYYKAPTTGIYDIAMLGPLGLQGNVDAIVPGDIALSHVRNFNADQKSSVAAWDVTVRSGTNSTTDLNGRLFAYYYALFGGPQGRPLYFSTYPITSDGFRYRMDLRGTDPGGFLLYGNQVGFFDRDGRSPLYHDALGDGAEVSNPEGGVAITMPQYPMFLNPIDLAVLGSIQRALPDGGFDGIGITAIPTLPIVSNLQFVGTTVENTSIQGTGGIFTFQANVSGNYQLVISYDGSNFDPTYPQNRVLRGTMPIGGGQTVPWNGKDNQGNDLPPGSNYPAQVSIHAGEYHFPLIDAENNVAGGPTITLLNQANPLGNTTAFYDDRGYRTLNGTIVGIIGQVLCGGTPPNPSFSNPITGFDTRSNDRKFGLISGGNTNQKCTGSFGDAKGLDLWTYFPSAASSAKLNIVSSNPGPPNLLLVKRITKLNGQTTTADGHTLATYIDSADNPDDDNTLNTPAPSGHPDTDKWPDPATFLLGRVDAGAVQPRDELEYTIYFLSAGRVPAHHVLLCDRVPTNVSFIPTAFNSVAPAPGGLVGDRGILALINGTTAAFTNTADGDAARYFPPNSDPTTIYPNLNCGGANTNGAVVINLGDLPHATAPGNPAGSFGFVRFKGRVK